MPSEKRKKSVIGAKDVKKKKRSKVKKSVVDEEVNVPKAEFLDIQTIREGMLVLGCIFEIRSDCLLMSLPGCLVGTVPITNVSQKFTEVLKDLSVSEISDETSLDSIFERGALYPCKVLQIIRESSRKPTIILSIDPQVVNSGLKIQSLFVDMVLYAAVASIEDHGYTMDTGIRGAQGFLPFNCAVSNELLCLGQVLPTYVKHLSSGKHDRGIISLKGLSFDDAFPEISKEDVKLSAVLPGARVSAYISEIIEPFMYLKCLNYDACSNLLSAYQYRKKIKEAVQVSGTVLYVHPVSNSIYIHLGPLPTPNTFDNFFALSKFDKIKNMKFKTSSHGKLFFKYKNFIGYVKSGDISKKTSLTYDSLMKNPIVPKARVVFLHYIDNFIQLTFKESLLKMKIVKPDEVQIGDIFDGTVKKHVENGLFVTICPGLSGFIRYILISDSYVTMPEKLYPVGTQVKCRVLSVHPTSGLNVTCKETLINLPKDQLLKSYEEAVKGASYKGVIVKKTDEFIIVLFFNNVQGIAVSENIPKASIFYVGQTVFCTVLSCNSAKKKLSLSLDTEKISKSVIRETQNPQSSVNKKDGINLKKMMEFSFVKSLPKPVYTEGKEYRAFIKKITAHQINILVNGIEKGRIHVTEIKCSKENLFPLDNFKVGQRLKVHILKEYERRRRNYLTITHRNTTSFLECSLKGPSTGKDSISNKPFMGFVRKIFDTYVSIWVSPNQCGRIDFVDLSENPKYLRKVKKNLSVGQSIKVSLLHGISSAENQEKEVKLIKHGISLPDCGKNVVGMITVASPDRELVFKLPHGYSGIVYPTDIQDVYSPLKPVTEKLLRLKFILCHVLEINHEDKTCILSLRKSKKYSEKMKSNKNISPDITFADITEGRVLKGYVKSKNDSQILVNICRNMIGKITLHKCSKYGCILCKKIADVQNSSSIGNVIEVVILGVPSGKGFIPLSLPNISDLESTDDTRLKIDEDIDWNDFQ